MLGTFSQYGVISQTSVIKVEEDMPLDKAVLVGCGVPTGWGSAVYAADVQPGETVGIWGIGGIGINAVQGARFAGATHVIAVDPLENQREKAMELGATHAVATNEEAMELGMQLTNGVGLDKAIMTIGVTHEPEVTAAFYATRKGGTTVLTGLGNLMENTVTLPGSIMTLFKKTVKGTLFGDCNPTTDIPMLLGLYQSGDLKLDELITKTYTLDQINEGYDDLLAGKNVRGVLIHEH